MAVPESGGRGLVLALDLGSTNLKAALYRAGGGRLAEGSVPVVYLTNETTSTGLSDVTLDAEVLWRSVVKLIGETCALGGVRPGAIKRIAVTSQAQTFALLGVDGVPLTPFVSWLDTRGAPYADEIATALGECFHTHCSFSSSMSELALSKLLWYRRRQPTLLTRAAHIALLPSYVVDRLVGLAVVDANLAAMSGLYSLRRHTWWGEALALCGLSTDKLPGILPMGTPVRAGRISADLALCDDVEIVPAGNDQTAGAYGNGCGEGDWVVTLGTALVAYRYAGVQPGPYSRLGCWGPYPGGGYYELGVRNQGCLALDWARSQLMPGKSVEDFVATAETAAAERVAPSCTVAGCFYPSQMASPGAWSGSPHLARRALAVLEGIGFSLRRLIHADLEVDRAPALITAVGGGSRSDFWLQLLADILNCPVRRGTGDARSGAAAMAAMAGSDVARTRDAATHTPQPIFRPAPERVEYYQRLYAAWGEHASGSDER